jgi:hypothetical protein
MNKRAQVHVPLSGAYWWAHSVGEKREAIPFAKLRSVVEKFNANRVPLARYQTEPLKCYLRTWVLSTPILKNEFGDEYQHLCRKVNILARSHCF